MANRLFDTKLNTLVKELVFLEGNAVIGGTGAVGNVKGSGIKGVTRTGTGAYTLVLDDTYPRYLGGTVGFIHTAAGGSGIAAVEVASYTVNTEVADGTGIKIKCYDYAGSAADPASGSVMGFIIWLRNSSVKGKGE